MATHPRPNEIFLDHGGHGDLDDIVGVMNAAFLPQYGEAWSRSQCAGILPMRGVTLLVARRGLDGAALGFALWRTLLDESELLLIAVAPASQGEGLGSLLLQHFIDAARAEGARRLHLEVRANNAAIQLYERAGFTLAGRRVDYYRGCAGDRHDALTYVNICT